MYLFIFLLKHKGLEHVQVFSLSVGFYVIIIECDKLFF